jgi:hypothetical protein
MVEDSRLKGLPAQEAEPQRPRQDAVLDADDREELLRIIAHAFDSERHANRLLTSIGFPREEIPNWSASESPLDWWDLVFVEFERGRVEQGFRRLLGRAVQTYPAAPRLFELYQRYTATPQNPEPQPDRGAPTCHVYIRVQGDEDRAAARETLSALSLDPREVLSTDRVVLYAVSSTDTSFVRAAMSRTDLPWTVASPEMGHYLLHTLIVQGPDGTQFRLRDTPSAVTVGTVASEIVATRYSGQDPQAVRETVVNRVYESGEQERINPDDTLEQANIPDGAQMQIGFDNRAGGTPPSMAWENAIARAANQISGFARQERIRLTTNRQHLPTRYDLHFTQPSFGPPPSPGEPPTRVDRHAVRLFLLDGFPNHPPDIFWQTPFFHPNVFPTYDCKRSRDFPQARGKVCLGELASGWYPAMDISEVCRVILDISTWRNYDVFGLTSADLAAGPHVNYFDPEAAHWALLHQQEIEDMGGSPLLPVLAQPTTVFRTSIDVIRPAAPAEQGPS